MTRALSQGAGATRAAPRILVVCPGGAASTGGMCRVVGDLAETWRARGLAPPLDVLDSGGMAPGLAKLAPFARALARVAADGARGRVALLHLHVAARGSVVRKACFVLLGRVFGIPVVLHMHGADFERFVAERGRFGRALVAAVFRAADGVVCLGARARDHARDVLGVAPDRLAIVPNGVALAAPRPVRDDRGDTDPRIAFVGALGVRKGLDTLLDALADPALAAVPLAVTIIGNGDVAHWTAEAARRGVADRVHFTGWLPNAAARAAIAASDILVLPSREEALPVAILEAMAEGVAVIATPVGEVADAVVDGETGLLVPPGDAAALARAIASLAGDPDRRGRLAVAGRARVETWFRLEHVADRLARLFGRAIGGAAPGHAGTDAIDRTDLGADAGVGSAAA